MSILEGSNILRANIIALHIASLALGVHELVRFNSKLGYSYKEQTINSIYIQLKPINLYYSLKPLI